MDRQLGHHRGATATPKPFGSRTPSPFVGRDEELRRLSDALASAAEGFGSTIFLTGQPGIGKTRLAREALALASAIWDQSTRPSRTRNRGARSREQEDDHWAAD